MIKTGIQITLLSSLLFLSTVQCHPPDQVAAETLPHGKRSEYSSSSCPFDQLFFLSPVNGHIGGHGYGSHHGAHGSHWLSKGGGHHGKHASHLSKGKLYQSVPWDRTLSPLMSKESGNVSYAYLFIFFFISRRRWFL